MFKGKTLSLTAITPDLAEIRFDRRGESVNKFDRLTIDELGEAVGLLEESPTVRGVLLSSGKDVFIVGADIFEFTSLFKLDEDALTDNNRQQNSVFNRLSRLPIPSVTAINGLAFGGGFEVCLATDFRIMSQTAQIGLPEVNLGLFPGLGGTSRLPRLSGADTAMQWIISGRPQKAQAALEAGAVDKVTAPDRLRDAAIELLSAAVARHYDWEAQRVQRSGGYRVNPEALSEARVQLKKSLAKVAAPHKAVDLIEQGANQTLDQALEAEHRAFAQVARTQSANALVQLFINDQFLRKKAREYTASGRKVANSTVLGAGIMGGGIAFTSASRGIPVLMKDINQHALDMGMGEAGKLLTKQVVGGRLDQKQADAVLAAIDPSLEFRNMHQVDAVVEAVVENLNIKKSVLAEVEAVSREDSVIASNTSSLSITELATALQRPENFVGMHFFNPVPVMPLVEVIRGEKTSPEAAATIASYAAAMGKTPIVVKDCPGFLVNRILTGNMVGFLRLIHDGADYQDIDAAMEEFGWPMGPAYLQDVVGMDTSAHVIEYITSGYGERLIPTYKHAVELMVEHKRLGQKNGVGFYRYEPDPKGRPIKSVDPQTAQLLKSVQPDGQRKFTSEEIVDRVMLPMIIEAARSLEERVVDTPIELDMALLLGIGFPRHVGGVLKYADWLGLDEIVRRCERYVHLGGIYQPTASMREMAKADRRFYDTAGS